MQRMNRANKHDYSRKHKSWLGNCNAAARHNAKMAIRAECLAHSLGRAN